MMARSPNRKSATAKEPMVSVVRTFFRRMFERPEPGNSPTPPPNHTHQHLHLPALGPRTPFSRCRMPRPARRRGVVGDHEDRSCRIRRRSAVRARSRTSSALFRSRSPVGSSHRRNVGSATMARAMETRCSWPPESWLGKWSMRSREAHQRQGHLHMPPALVLPSLVSRSGSSTFWNAVRTGRRLYSGTRSPRGGPSRRKAWARSGG